MANMAGPPPSRCESIGDERPQRGHHCRAVAPFDHGLSQTVCPSLSPSHLKAAVEGVAVFGKAPAAVRENQILARESRPVSNGTVTETGTVGSVGDRSGVEAVEKMVPPIRIERTTNGLGNRCSIQLSYGGMKATILNG